MNKIGLTNVKGITKSYELEKVNLFLGNMGKGKSTVIDGLRFFLGGIAVDENGKTMTKNEDVFDICSSNSMEVALTNQDGEFKRGMVKKVKKVNEEFKTSFSKTAYSPTAELGSTTTQNIEDIEDQFGVPKEILNMGEFTRKSATDKSKFVMTMYKVNGSIWDKEKLISMMLEYGNCETDEAKEKFETLVTEAAGKIIDENFDFESIIDHYKEKYSLNESKFDKKTSAKKELLAIEAEHGNNVVAGLSKLEKDIKDQINNQSDIAGKIKEVENNNEKITNNTSKIEGLEKDIEALMNEELDIKGAKSAYDKKVKEVNKLNKSNDTLAEKVRFLNEEITADDKSIKTYDDQIKEKNNDISNAEASLEGFNSAKDIIISRIPKIKDEVEKASVEYKVEVDNKKVDINAEIEHLNKLKDELSQKVSDKSTEADNHGKTIKKNDNLITEINVEAAKTNHQTVVDKKENRTEKVDIIKKNIKQLKDDIKDITVQDTADLKLEKIAVNENIGTLRTKKSEKEKVKNDLLNLQKISDEVADLKPIVDSLKNIRLAVGPKGVMNEILKTTLMFMVKGINENLKAFGIKDKFFVELANDNGTKIFKYGLIGENKRYKLSKGEFKIIDTAIQIEFMNKISKNFRILMIDDLNHINKTASYDFIKGLIEIQEKFDIVLLAANFEDYEVIDGANIVRL